MEPPPLEQATRVAPSTALAAIAVATLRSTLAERDLLFMVFLSLLRDEDGQDAQGGRCADRAVFSRHCLTLPALNPDCQYRCRKRKATTIGTIVRRDPVMTRL
ncbi:hypothetical protein GCM10009617_03930 [Leifsonia poae]